MEASVLVTTAGELLELYREALILDPFYRIKVEIAEGDFISNCSLDKTSPLTWVLRLNPARHDETEDVAYSVLEALLRVLFYTVEIAGPEKAEEARDGLISRLAMSLAGILPLTASEPEPNTDETAE